MVSFFGIKVLVKTNQTSPNSMVFCLFLVESMDIFHCHAMFKWMQNFSSIGWDRIKSILFWISCGIKSVSPFWPANVALFYWKHNNYGVLLDRFRLLGSLYVCCWSLKTLDDTITSLLKFFWINIYPLTTNWIG